MNENRTYNHSDKVKWAVAFLLIFVLLAGLIGAWVVLLTGDKTEDETPPAEEVETSYGGAVIGESVGNGVKLMSAKIAAADYAEYGISTMAEKAYQLTATVEPADAGDKNVDWSVSFVNPLSSWASGKTVTDYVTVTPTSDGALTANVECKQAFGEQIKVTVTSRENTNVYASCTVDYAQRLRGASLGVGSINTVYQDETPVTWEVATNVQGQGGKAQFKYTTGDVYTIADSYSVEYHVDSTYKQPSGSDFVSFSVSDSLATDIQNGENIYFDCSFFQKYVTASWGMTISAYGWQSGFTNIFLSPIAAQSNPGDYLTIDLTVTIGGTYSSYIYYTSITVGGLMNNSVITGLSLNETGLVF